MADHLPNLIPDRPVGRNGRGDGYNVIAGQKMANKSDSADIDIPVFFGEAQSLAQMGAHYIAVQDLMLDAPALKFAGKYLADGAFPGSRKTGEPDRKAGVVAFRLDFSQAGLRFDVHGIILFLSFMVYHTDQQISYILLSV